MRKEIIWPLVTILFAANVAIAESMPKAAPAYAEDLYQKENTCKEKDKKIGELEKLNAMLKKKIILLEEKVKSLENKADKK